LKLIILNLLKTVRWKFLCWFIHWEFKFLLWFILLIPLIILEWIVVFLYFLSLLFIHLFWTCYWLLIMDLRNGFSILFAFIIFKFLKRVLELLGIIHRFWFKFGLWISTLIKILINNWFLLYLFILNYLLGDNFLSIFIWYWVFDVLWSWILILNLWNLLDGWLILGLWNWRFWGLLILYTLTLDFFLHWIRILQRYMIIILLIFIFKLLGKIFLQGQVLSNVLLRINLHLFFQLLFSMMSWCFFFKVIWLNFFPLFFHFP